MDDLHLLDGGEAPFCLPLGLAPCLSLIRVLNAALLSDVAYADARRLGDGRSRPIDPIDPGRGGLDR